MATNDVIIPLARNANVESLPGGEAQIHYTPPSVYPLSQGAKALLINADIFQISANTKLKFEMEWSLDGVTWNGGALPFDGRSSGTELDSVGSFQHLYTGKPFLELRAPIIRYGIKVWTTDGSKGSVRLTALVIAIKSAEQVSWTHTVAEDVTIQDSKTEEVIGDIVAVEAFSSVEFNGQLSAVPTNTVTLKVQTSTRKVPGMYVTVATIPVADANPFAAKVSELGSYARVVYDSTTAGSPTLDADFTLKSF